MFGRRLEPQVRVIVARGPDSQGRRPQAVRYTRREPARPIMPIVDIEVVTCPADSEVVDKETPQLLADDLGRLFGGEPGSTWVRLRSIGQDAYAENSGGVPGSQAQPAFVSILRAESPERAALGREMAGVARSLPGCWTVPERTFACSMRRKRGAASASAGYSSSDSVSRSVVRRSRGTHYPVWS